MVRRMILRVYMIHNVSVRDAYEWCGVVLFSLRKYCASAPMVWGGDAEKRSDTWCDLMARWH